MKMELFKKEITSEKIAALFFHISEDRYPVSDKILQQISKLIDPLTEDEYEQLLIKISVAGAIRNMVREVSPNRLYRSIQHRDDLLAAIIEACELLEDELEELEESIEKEEE